MKKITILFILMLAALSACGTEEAESMSPVEPQTILLDEVQNNESKKEAAELETESAVPGSESELQPSGDDFGGTESQDREEEVYRKSYMQLVQAYEENGVSFSLIYLDDDDIPELVVYDGGYGCYSVYTVKDGAAFCVADSLYTVELTYFERSGIVASFARWNGGGDEGGYGKSYYQITADGTLTDESSPVLSFSYNAVYDENDAYTGTGITSYYYMGEETDQVTYQETCSNLGILEENERLCMENTLGKKEVQDLFE